MHIHSFVEWMDSIPGTVLVVGLQGLEYMHANLKTLYSFPLFFQAKLAMKLLMIFKDTWIIFEDEIASFWIQKLLFKYKGFFFTSFIKFLDSVGHFTLAQSWINALFTNSILVFTSASPWKF